MTTIAPPTRQIEPPGLRYEILELALMVTPAATGDRGLRILELGTDPDPYAQASLAAKTGNRTGRLVSISECLEITRNARNLSATRGLAFHTGPLSIGWPDHAPYDLVVSLQLVDQVPHAWLNQLVPGGRVIAPVRLTEPAGHIGLLTIDLDRDRLLDWPQHLLIANPTRTGLQQWRSAGARLTSTAASYTVASTPTHNPRRPNSAFPEVWIDDPAHARWLRTIDPTEPAHLAVTEHPTAGIPWIGLCDRAFNPATDAAAHPRCPKCVKRLNRHLSIGTKRR